MEADVFRRLEEVLGSSVRWSVQDVDDAINEGLQELSDATEFFERVATLTLKANTNYYDLRSIVPDTILRVTNIFNPTNNLWLIPIDIRDLDYKTARQWELVQGEPQKYFLRGLFHIGIYPAPNYAATLKVNYRAVHPTLTDSNQSPQQLPDDYHTNIVDYAVYTLLTDDIEITQAQQFYNRYKEAEDELSGQCASGGRASTSRIRGMGFWK